MLGMKRWVQVRSQPPCSAALALGVTGDQGLPVPMSALPGDWWLCLPNAQAMS